MKDKDAVFTLVIAIIVFLLLVTVIKMVIVPNYRECRDLDFSRRYCFTTTVLK